MNAQYLGSGPVAEYITMYYTFHMNTHSLWQTQHNYTQPSFIADSCIGCGLRHADSTQNSVLLSSADQFVLLPLLAIKKVVPGSTIFGVAKEEILPVKATYFLLPPTVTTPLQITPLECNIHLQGLINIDFIEMYLELPYSVFEITYRMLYKSMKGSNMTHQQDYRSVMIVLYNTRDCR